MAIRIQGLESCGYLGIMTGGSRRIDFEEASRTAFAAVDQLSAAPDALAHGDVIDSSVTLGDLPTNHLDQQLPF